MIGLLDYGLSNIRSVQKAFEHLELETRLISQRDQIAAVERLVLPGVGAFAAGMAGLERSGLTAGVQEAVAAGMPLLGICLGMQLLFERGEEDGDYPGLGLLPGSVPRFAVGSLPVPHMGWNQLNPVSSHELLDGLPQPAYAYFVHSYVCQPQDPAIILAEADYGGPFAAIVGRHPVYGLQFHPEKSQGVGLRLLRNFASLPPRG